MEGMFLPLTLFDLCYNSKADRISPGIIRFSIFIQSYFS